MTAHANAGEHPHPLAGAGSERAHQAFDSERALALTAKTQGVYYLVTGAWPALDSLTFQFVTGVKNDYWLAETVGLLLVVAGAVLLLAGCARRVTREIALLGAGLAATLGSVDIWCVYQPLATRAYWLDALMEGCLLAAWCAFARRRTKAGSPADGK